MRKEEAEEAKEAGGMMVEKKETAERVGETDIPNPHEPDKPYPTPPLRFEYVGGVFKIYRGGQVIHSEAIGKVAEFVVEYGGET